MSDKSNNIQTYDIIIVGQHGVGKTSLMNRYLDDRFTIYTYPTIGLDFRNKFITHNNTKNIVKIWDTAGQEKYYSLVKTFFKNGKCAFICFSLENFNTFESVCAYVGDILLFGNDNVNIILVGTFSDKKNTHTVNYNQIKDFSELYDIKYFEVSSLTGEGIRELFDYAFNSIDLTNKSKSNKTIDNDIIKKNNIDNRKEKKNKNGDEKVNILDIEQKNCCVIS